MAREFISLVPEGSPHRVAGERRVILRNISLQILTTRLIELNSWNLEGLNDPFWRLYSPVSGRAIVWAEMDSGEVETELIPGRAYLIPPRTTLRSTNPEPFSKWYVHFSLGLSGDRATPGVYPVELTESMQANLAKLPSLTEVPFPWISAALVAEALQQLPADVWMKHRVDSRVERAMDFMHANLTRKLSAEGIAAEAGLSVRNLNHLFQQHVQMAPMRVLLDFRLDKACRLLRHNDTSIEQIAEECGFPNRYYFSRMLKQHRGTSPAAYRRAEV
jgi:AraC-like DNA-binding protein